MKKHRKHKPPLSRREYAVAIRKCQIDTSGNEHSVAVNPLLSAMSNNMQTGSSKAEEGNTRQNEFILRKEQERKKQRRKTKNAHLKSVTIKKSILQVKTLSNPSLIKSCDASSSSLCPPTAKDQNSSESFSLSTAEPRKMAKASPQTKTFSIPPWPGWHSDPAQMEMVKSQGKHPEQMMKQRHPSGLICSRIVSERSIIPDICLIKEMSQWIILKQEFRESVFGKSRFVKDKISSLEPCTSKSCQEKLGKISTQHSPNPSVREIPGFYFDPVRSCYFRIVSGANNRMESVVTREKIEAMKKEQQRKVDLGSFSISGQLDGHECQTSYKNKSNIIRVLDAMRVGNIAPRRGASCILHSRVASIRSSIGSKFASLLGARLAQMCVSPSGLHFSAAFYTRSGQGDLVVQVMKIDSLELEKNDHVSERLHPSGGRGGGIGCISSADALQDISSASLSVKKVGSEVYLPARHVYDMTFAACDNNPEAHRVLSCMPNSSPDLHDLYLCSVGNLEKNVLSSNATVSIRHQPLRCAVRGEHCAVATQSAVLLFDFTRPEHMQRFSTGNAMTLSLAFANMTPNVFFLGMKNQIRMYDARHSDKNPVAFLSHTHRTETLFLTKDDLHLVSSFHCGMLSRWDLRLGKIVLNYEGNINECKRLSVVVDQREEFLGAVGSDSYSRIWDFKTSELMKVIPPPLPTNSDFLPFIGFSSGHHPGLLLGMQDELHFYTF